MRRRVLVRRDDGGGAALDALLLLSRYLAWTGDPAPLHAVWPQVRRAAVAEPLGTLLCDVVASRWGSCVGATRCAA